MTVFTPTPVRLPYRHTTRQTDTRPRPAPRVRLRAKGTPAPGPSTRNQPRVIDIRTRADLPAVTLNTLYWAGAPGCPFAGTQQQVNQIKELSETRAAERKALFTAHHVAKRRWKILLHAGLFPLLLRKPVCKCGRHFPCGAIKAHLRKRLGWHTNLGPTLKQLTKTTRGFIL